MVAFMDESVVDARKGSSLIRETLQSHYKTIVSSKGSFPHPQFSSQQIPDPLTPRLTGQHSLFSVFNALPAKTVTNDFITKGGDVKNLKLNWLGKPYSTLLKE